MDDRTSPRGLLTANAAFGHDGDDQAAEI